MTSVVAIPGTDWQQMLQMPASDEARAQPAISDMLIYLLPAGALLVLLGWLAAEWLSRSSRLLAGQAGKPGRQQGSGRSGAMESTSHKDNGLKKGRPSKALGQQPSGLPAVDPADNRLDPVTGQSTPEILLELVANISLSGTGFTAVALAVDDYQHMQEHFPQEQLDQAFKRLAGLLLKYSRELDISVRMGEEVFLLLLPQCPPVIAQRIAERLRGKVQDSFFEGINYMTISVGVADYQPGNGDALQTLKDAQQQLIAARREGQNRVRVTNGG